MNIKYIFTMGNKWTFQIKPIFEYLTEKIKQHKKVLIPFCGFTRFHEFNYIDYIDINENLPQPYILGNNTDIIEKMIQENKKYDLVILDPPYSSFQSILLYNGKKQQEITICRNLINKILTDNCEVISFGYNSTGMSKKRNFEKTDLHIFNLGGSHNDILMLTEIRRK